MDIALILRWMDNLLEECSKTTKKTASEFIYIPTVKDMRENIIKIKDKALALSSFLKMDQKINPNGKMIYNMASRSAII